MFHGKWLSPTFALMNTAPPAIKFGGGDAYTLLEKGRACISARKYTNRIILEIKEKRAIFHGKRLSLTFALIDTAPPANKCGGGDAYTLDKKRRSCLSTQKYTYRRILGINEKRAIFHGKWSDRVSPNFALMNTAPPANK